MVGINSFFAIASLVLANVGVPVLASPALRTSDSHWGGFGALVQVALQNDGQFSNKGAHLASSAPPGEPGKVVLGANEQAAPFYILDNQLYQVTNVTSILYVNIVNTTSPATSLVTQGNVNQGAPDLRTQNSPHTRLPSFRLQLDNKKEGVRGTWMWDSGAERLAFMTQGTTKLAGNFYSCHDRLLGMSTIHVDLDLSTRYPVNCQLMKMY